MNWLKGRFKYAFSGFRYALMDRSILLQFVFGLIVIIAGFLFRLTVLEWILILICICTVIFAEIVNSCIENLVDYISLKHTPQGKKIKDMAAAAVLLISVMSAAIGLMIFLPKLF